MDWVLLGKFLLLLAAANGGPVLAHKLWDERGAWPLDGGRCWRDGRPWLGASKTWRGLAASLLLSALAAPVLGWPGWLGAWAAAWSMAGDLCSSFIKRRLGLPSSARATGLDQIPEALLPALALAPWLGWGPAEIGLAVLGFFLGAQGLSPLLFRCGIRRQPY